MVTCPVLRTKRANSALVTGRRSIPNPSTVTLWAGASGEWASEPIRKVPPGIQTMPAGAGEAGVIGIAIGLPARGEGRLELGDGLVDREARRLLTWWELPEGRQELGHHGSCRQRDVVVVDEPVVVSIRSCVG